MSDIQPNERYLHSFGRRHGRKLSPEKQALMQQHFAKFSIDIESLASHADIQSYYSKPQPVWLEIGSGDGMHLSMLAQHYPHINFIGADPYIPGVAHLLDQVVEHQLDNVRIFADDVRLLLDKIANQSLERVYILFPDPWPKKRHHKRRIVSTAMLNRLAAMMPAGGILQLATDHQDYAEWMIETAYHHPSFEWMAECQKDWQTPPKEWVETKYQARAKRIGNNEIIFLTFKRV